MANTKDTKHNRPAIEAPLSERDAAVADRTVRGSDTLSAMQTALSLDTSGFSEEEALILKRASVARYTEFASTDATERVLATLSVGLQNAVMTSLQYAANANTSEARAAELRNATRGAKVVADLVGALDRHRGRGKQDVQVGQVTVERGGQAVVGNVSAEGRSRSKPEKPDDPNEDPFGSEE
jgi:hypothetical protein